jgi:hypothetical protein
MKKGLIFILICRSLKGKDNAQDEENLRATSKLMLNADYL